MTERHDIPCEYFKQFKLGTEKMVGDLYTKVNGIEKQLSSNTTKLDIILGMIALVFGLFLLFLAWVTQSIGVQNTNIAVQNTNIAVIHEKIKVIDTVIHK